MDSTNEPIEIRKTAAWGLFIAWAILSSVLMWNLFNDDYRNFLHSETNVEFESKTLDMDTPEGQLTFVHFIDHSCSCTRFSLPHIEDLEQQYPGANHIRIDKHGKSNPIVQSRNTSQDQQADWGWAVSSPSVAVFSDSGKLAYYGPYNDGAICGQGNSLLETVVNNLQTSSSFQWVNLLGYGCFCNWGEEMQSAARSSIATAAEPT